MPVPCPHASWPWDPAALRILRAILPQQQPPFHHHRFIRTASTLRPRIKRETRGAIGNVDPRVNPTSLRKTLDAHRAANQASLIPEVEGSINKFNDQLRKKFNGYQSKGIPPANLERLRRQADLKIVKPPGKVIQPTGPWILLHNPIPFERQCPWMQYMEEDDLKMADPLRRLNAEIRAFERFMSPTDKEKAAINAAYHDILAAMDIKPNRVQVIGSQRTGLASFLSDIDINIGLATSLKARKLGERGPSPGRPKARKENLGLLYKVRDKLQLHPNQFKVHLIRARVPINQGTHKPTGIKFDIQSTIEGPGSLEYVMNYLNEFSVLRSLQFVVRHALNMRDLDSTSTQGLGSYTTLNMIVAVLKFGNGRFDRSDAAGPLLSFLEFYSHFDSYKQGISVEPPELFMKREPGSSKSNRMSSGAQESYTLCRHLVNVRNHEFPFLMCLQDPADPSNDLGKLSSRFVDIQATLHDCLERMKALRKEYVASSDLAKTKISLLEPLLGADYQAFLNQRTRVSLGLPMDTTLGVDEPKIR